MKLRNKKTGRVVEDSDLGKLLTRYEVPSYDSLKELNEEWEDYTPPEPLIKDPKIRKFVRDWAVINDIKVVLVCQTFNAWGFKNKPDGELGDKEYMTADILFRGEKPEELEFFKEYTITEL